MNNLFDQQTKDALSEALAAARAVAVECRYCPDTNMLFSGSGKGAITGCMMCRSSKETRNAAANKLARAAFFRMQHDLEINQTDFEIARLLTLYTSDQPIKREIIDRYASTDERATKKHIENLRDEWLLPIGSRKTPPYGHWIIVEKNDYLRWEAEARRSPLTQLSTLWRLRKANFPEFAGQTELDFAQEISTELT